MYTFRIKITNNFGPFNFNSIQNQVSNSYAKIVVVGNIESIEPVDILRILKRWGVHWFVFDGI